MTKKSDKFTDKFTDKIEKWDDEECLFNFSRFFNRVGISTEFIQDEDGLIVAQMLIMNCGDKIIRSEPQLLEWPLQPASVDEETLKDNGVALN
jgi:hypothetical protein